MVVKTDFDLAVLRAFLCARLSGPPGLTGPMTLQRIGGGQSNPTWFVSFDNRRLVLRMQPAGNLLPGAHAVDREARVMQALAGSALPVPKVLLFHAGREVVGTPFYVMERVEGRVFADCALPGMDAAERRAIYLAMADTMATLHRVDWAACGLADYGRQGGYFSRQIARWSRQSELSQQSATKPNADIEALRAWLPAHLPGSATPLLRTYRQLIGGVWCNAAGGDGLQDLELKFDSEKLAAALPSGAVSACVVLKLTGRLKAEFGGTDINGEDVLSVKRK